MFKWSIATVCMGGTLEVKLSAAARAGFRAVEIFENDLTFFNGKPSDVRRMADDLGLAIVALQPMRDFEGMPEPARSRNMDRARRKLDLMEELGAPLLCICSNVSEEALEDRDAAAADLAALADEAAQRGCRIGYEALAWGRRVKDWMDAWDLVRRADRPNCGLVLDSFHACVRKNPLAPIAEIPGDRIALVQVADAPGLLMDPLSLSRHHRSFPGQGDFAVDEFMQAVGKSGYRGPVSLEIFNDQFRGASANAMALDGMRSLQTMGERLNAARAAAGERPIAGVAALPPPPAVRGVEFVEFAAGDSDMRPLADLLTGLGFSAVGHHRSKEVTLFRQNGVNLVLNREKEGFSHAFSLVHGPSVCAVALSVDDVGTALDRAEALGAATYSGRVGPGEATIPAVRGVEGSLLYVVKTGQDFWAQDFEIETAAPATGGLRRIDHLSNVVRRSEFLTWTLFYKSVLGFVDEPQVELADPYGAFYSRSVRSPDGSVRIPLNIADGGSTMVSRFIEEFGGAGVQQIAFETDDLLAFVEAARSRGVTFLDIPDNYYEDLAARFDLDPLLLDRMRALGVLYDRAGQGEFFHIYTQTYRNRFFFEVVERRGYDLFGAANTPIRLAAQAMAQDRQRDAEFNVD
ncbi:TIM barrel protein [Alsobacter sp. KACC 23698]|uniref:3-dehydroshikimate dehydratase n=1 Tax=Alsobacter sp. KACC 23698 TaxID=3149229 RepID=A0AAU7JLV4_9HYPH